MTLAGIAPRLARARDQWEAEQARARARRRRREAAIFRLRRVIEHRELQLLRAGATRSRGYILIRQRKLDTARADLARLEARS